MRSRQLTLYKLPIGHREGARDSQVASIVPTYGLVATTYGAPLVYVHDAAAFFRA